MSKAVRLLPAIAVLLIIGGIGTHLSRAGEKIKIAVWETVHPKLVTALVGEVMGVKVGLGYQFTELDFLDETALGFQWVVNPKKAGARQVLKVYDLNLVLDHWDDIRAEFRQNPANVAFMTKRENVYYGTPVKWNKGFANGMEGIRQAWLAWGVGSSNVFAQAAAEEIVTLAAFNQASPILAKSSPRALQVLGVDQQAMETGWPDQSTMDLIHARNVEAVESLRPAVMFYIAFSHEPKTLRDVPSLANVVSTSGWQGETLGEAVTGWPIDKRD